METRDEIVKAVADLRELGASSVHVEVTRGGTLRLVVSWDQAAPKRHDWAPR